MTVRAEEGDGNARVERVNRRVRGGGVRRDVTIARGVWCVEGFLHARAVEKDV